MPALGDPAKMGYVQYDRVSMRLASEEDDNIGYGLPFYLSNEVWTAYAALEDSLEGDPEKLRGVLKVRLEAGWVVEVNPSIVVEFHLGDKLVSQEMYDIPREDLVTSAPTVLIYVDPVTNFVTQYDRLRRVRRKYCKYCDSHVGSELK
jgi:hypothetical protein